MNQISITEDKTATVHKHSRRIEFDGAPPQEHHAYSHRNKLFIPVMATTTWGHGRQPEVIFIRGPLVKKDGTPSEIFVDFKYATPASGDWGVDRRWSNPDAPEWLLKLFGLELPDTTDKSGLGALESVLSEFGGKP